MCVCVCFESKCLTFFLLRDVFESLKYCLDIWLSSIFDCIHICAFLFFEKLFLSISTASRYHSTTFNLSSPFFLLVSTKVITISIHRDVSTKVIAISIHQNFWTLSRSLFDRFSIHRETFCLADRSSTGSRSIEVGFCSIASRFFEILLHALFFTCFASFFYLFCIASCFITFMHLYGFLVPP